SHPIRVEEGVEAALMESVAHYLIADVLGDLPEALAIGKVLGRRFEVRAERIKVRLLEGIAQPALIERVTGCLPKSMLRGLLGALAVHEIVDEGGGVSCAGNTAVTQSAVDLTGSALLDLLQGAYALVHQVGRNLVGALALRHVIDERVDHVGGRAPF